MSKKCRDCFHFYGVAEDMNGEVGMCELQSSECPNYRVAGQNACKMFNAQTVFHQITASPDVLARSLCGNVRVGCFSGYYSMLTGQHYPNMEEAIAATLERLNSLINDVKEKVE